ncbi:PAS domain-containing protein, partial [Desulfovibrio sp. OttesenSCG-928-C06]|nr:PAS domain-containing protein [Desulfovibrio sp. OttesenSCG-928-C06]
MSKGQVDISGLGLPDIIEGIPAVAFRLSHEEDNWRTWFVTGSISMFGYTVDDFMEGRVTWFDLVHPDDRVFLSKTVSDYEAHNVNTFRLYYRIVTGNGDVVPVTEYSTAHRDKSGKLVCYDSYLVSSVQAEADKQIIDDHHRQQVVLAEILMSLHGSNLDNALQIILDRTGEYLNTSRALLFKDSPDHKTCKIVYEWCNRDISSVMALDYSITYETGMPEIYIALQNTGSLIINAGGIPENCKEEFEAEGLVASAIFAVYLDGDHYGFVCFDDCVIERVWDDDTVRFLKNVTNIISTVLAQQSAEAKLAQNHRT